jgi:hypothetical protein
MGIASLAEREQVVSRGAVFWILDPGQDGGGVFEAFQVPKEFGLHQLVVNRRFVAQQPQQGIDVPASFQAGSTPASSGPHPETVPTS